MPEVSVLIPCRNGERWLAQAISSTMACAGVTEVIVADDGSTDGSASIAEGFGAKVRCLRLPARGGNAARNAALQAARGDWLQFLDADDYLEPHKIVRQFEEAGDLNELDILYSPVWIETWRDGHAVDRQSSTIEITSDLFTQWVTWQLPQTGGVLWRAAALRRIGGWNEAMPCCQEHELYLRALLSELHWKYCPTPGSIYRIWSENTVCRKDPVRVIRMRTSLIDQMMEWLIKTDRLTQVHRSAAGQAFFQMARTWAKYDLRSATAYYRERRALGLIKRLGAAAPLRYRIAIALLGFSMTERLAHRLRAFAQGWQRQELWQCLTTRQ